MWSSRPYTFDRVVRIVFTLAVLGIAIYVVFLLRDVLLPFCVACLVAYILEPWVEWNMRILHIKNRTLTVVLTTFEGLLILGILCIIFVPIVEKECEQLAVLLHQYIQKGHEEISLFPSTVHHFIHNHLDLKIILEKLEQINTAGAFEQLWHGISSGLDKILGLLGWLIAFLYVIFILLDFDKYKNGLINLVPKKYLPDFYSIVGDLSWSMKRYFRNQALISFLTGLCYVVGFSIVGIPMAVVIGLLCMVLFMVPYLVYVSLIPVTLMCVFKSMETGIDFWTIWLECLTVYAFVEAFSDMVLTPKIMGKAMGLNPAVIFLSLSVWGSLLGLLGMVIALPATTILSKWANIWLTNWRNKVNAESPDVSSEPPPDGKTSKTE